MAWQGGVACTKHPYVAIPIYTDAHVDDVRSGDYDTAAEKQGADSEHTDREASVEVAAATDGAADLVRADVPADLATPDDSALEHDVTKDSSSDASGSNSDGAVDGLQNGIDAQPPSCVGLDECACAANSACAPIAEPCYCPNACDPGISCFCGGGRFIGCAPAGLSGCAAAAARVAPFCPNPTAVPSLCGRDSPECATKCLNEATSCVDVSCSICAGCFCAEDAFSVCYDACVKSLT